MNTKTLVALGLLLAGVGAYFLLQPRESAPTTPTA